MRKKGADRRQERTPEEGRLGAQRLERRIGRLRVLGICRELAQRIDPARILRVTEPAPLTGEKSGAPHEALYWRFGQQIALRMGDWKLVKGAGSKSIQGADRQGKASTVGAELYNLKQDIGEKENLADKNPEKLRELAAVWEKFNSGMVDPAWGPNSGAPGKKAGKGKKKKAGVE